MLISFPEGEDLDVHVINATTGQVIDRAIADRDSTRTPRLLLLPAGEYRVGITLYVRDGDNDRDVDYSVDSSSSCASGR